MIHQNSAKVAAVAEELMNKRSLKRTCTMEDELGGIDLESQLPTKRKIDVPVKQFPIFIVTISIVQVNITHEFISCLLNMNNVSKSTMQIHCFFKGASFLLRWWEGLAYLLVWSFPKARALEILYRNADPQNVNGTCFNYLQGFILRWRNFNEFFFPLQSDLVIY